MNESNQDTVIIDVAIVYTEFNSTGDQYQKRINVDVALAEMHRNLCNYARMLGS